MADITNDDFAPSGTGGSGIVKEGDDIKESSKTTLASYMSSLTTNAQTHNAYPIEDSSFIETSYQAADGTPAQIETGGQDAATDGYTDRLGTGEQASAARAYFGMLSNSGKFDEVNPTAEPLSSFMDKNNQTDGHTILSNIHGTRPPFEPGVGNQHGEKRITTPAYAPVQQHKISAILSGYNRFNPNGDSPYIEDGAFSHSGATEQGDFGVYTPDGDEIKFDELRKVASSMLLRQTGHAKGEDRDPDDVTALNAIRPTAEQIGDVKITMDFLRAINAFGAPAKPSLDAELLYNEDGSPITAQKSFGALNSPLEPFSGPNRLAMLGVAIGGLGALVLGSVAVGAVLELILLTDSVSSIPSAPAEMKKGHHRDEIIVTRVVRMLGVPALNHSFIMCVIFGIIEFFGMAGTDPPDFRFGWAGIGTWWMGLVSRIDTIVQNVILSSGYYASLLRTLRRDLDRLLSQMGDIVSGDTATNPALAIFQLMTSLNSFPSFRFFMVLAIIGDVALSRKDRAFAFGGRNSNPLEKMPDNGQTRQAKSRVGHGRNELAWRHRSAPARFILPQQLKTAFTIFDLGGETPQVVLDKVGDRAGDPGDTWPDDSTDGASHWQKKQRSPEYSRVSRLPQELVSQLEDQLEIEYMPFYFHDLRTNEIVGFHAFLSNIKDSYSVNYQDSSGYGRIDKVKIYQSTERSVSVDFWLVSTSPKDFDSMWWSVNWLITLLYPQWSMGKRVQAGTKHFIMPFSQIPTASPMIRLRVGDVIRSNYSRFNLARLFGISEAIAADESGTNAEAAASEGAAFDISFDTAANADAVAYQRELEAHQERYSTEPQSPGDTAHGYNIGEVAVLYPSPAIGYTTYDRGPTPHSPAPPTATHVELTAFRSRPGTWGVIQIVDVIWIGAIVPSDDPTEETRIPATPKSMTGAGHNVEYVVRYVDRDDDADPYGPVSEKGHWHEYYVTQDWLWTPSPRMEESDAVVTLDDQTTAVVDFFDPSNNAIVSSFESAGGRGLAGFITSFDMDYGDAMWDMDGMGRRAPQAIKVSIQFAPIHDIPPGIDNNGFMRSVNYPVGEIAGMFATDQYDRGSASNVRIEDGSGGSRRAGGVDGGALTRERFEDAVRSAWGRYSEGD